MTHIMITLACRGSHTGLVDSHRISRSRGTSMGMAEQGISFLTNTAMPPHCLCMRFLLKDLKPWMCPKPSVSELYHDSVTTAMSTLLSCSTDSSSSTLLVRQQAFVRKMQGKEGVHCTLVWVCVWLLSNAVFLGFFVFVSIQEHFDWFRE